MNQPSSRYFEFPETDLPAPHPHGVPLAGQRLGGEKHPGPCINWCSTVAGLQQQARERGQQALNERNLSESDFAQSALQGTINSIPAWVGGNQREGVRKYWEANTHVHNLLRGLGVTGQQRLRPGWAERRPVGALPGRLELRTMNERPQGIFADVHREDGRVHVTLLHDPNVEGLDVALYLDGSASMRDEYGHFLKGHKIWSFLFGPTYRALAQALPAPREWAEPNVVEPQARRMLDYLAGKDRNERLRVAYWACGQDGKAIEVVGELGREQASAASFPGPSFSGRATCLAPALRDYLDYFRAQQAPRGLAVFISDGALHDADEVMAVSEEAARLPVNFVLVGVGQEVQEDPLEAVSQRTYGGREHLWCHRIATEIEELAQLVAVLVDETMTVAGGGTIYVTTRGGWSGSTRVGCRPSWSFPWLLSAAPLRWR